MATVTVSSEKTGAAIKPLHAVNNGPVVAGTSQKRGNIENYKAMKVPYVRNHDSAFFTGYGGEHSVDIHVIFPDFDRDVNDPDAYDFTNTDKYLNRITDAGSEVFYRLGGKIQHTAKKYGIHPPKDFKKWAEICEHVIMHYNEGWANGFELGITYWEIWNEPDLGYTNPETSPCWSGTPEQYFEFYEVAATHLKKRFPQLKIGGPAVTSSKSPWNDEFFKAITKDGKKVPLDFFSWHRYAHQPVSIKEGAAKAQEYLDKFGYSETESICNEWNFVEDWGDNFPESIRTIISMKGAAFCAGTMFEAQDTTVDMLMYYDARPCAFNGLFDFYDYHPLKTFYVMKMFGEHFYKKSQLKCTKDDCDIFTLAAADENGKRVISVCYYSTELDAEKKQVKINLDENAGSFDVYLLDETRDAEKILAFYGNGIEINLNPQSVLYLIEKQ
ncbi:MAG: glycosyl hydrolase [Monoglobales bacterium]